MPQPEGAALDFGYSPVLTNIAINFLPKLEQFVGARIFPPVPVAAPTGSYNVWLQEDFLRRNGKELANYEAEPLGGFAGSQATYSVRNWAVGSPYTARDLAAARMRGTSDQAFRNLKTRWVVTQAMLELEFRVRDLVQTTANWSTTRAGVSSGPTGTQFIQWDQAATATPVANIDEWVDFFRLSTGVKPNTLVITPKIWRGLRKSADLIDRVKYGGTMDKPTEITMNQLKALFNIENIIIPEAVYNSAAEGATAVYADIWTQTVGWLGYVAPEPSSETPSAGYQFRWTGDVSAGLPAALTGEGPQFFGAAMNDNGVFMREYLDQPRGAVVIGGQIWSSPNVAAASLGMTFTAMVA